MVLAEPCTDAVKQLCTAAHKNLCAAGSTNDDNGDGKMSKEEIAIALDDELDQIIRSNVAIRGPGAALVGQLFDAIDADGSGVLEKEEGKSLFAALGSDLGSRCCGKIGISVGTSRASLPYLAAHASNSVAGCLHMAHIAVLRVFWTDWCQRKRSS